MVELAPSGASYELGFAGDTYNTAWYLAALRPDFEVSFLSRVGQDALSDRFIAQTQDAGIGTAYITRMPDRNLGLYLITLNGGERSFSYWRDTSAARCLADDVDDLDRAIDAHDLIYFSGISIAILSDRARARLLERLRVARAAGKRVAFDPNLRPKLWASVQEMTDAVSEAGTMSDVVLPSFEDEAAYFRDPSPEATAARYGELGASLVVVKDGASPVLFVNGQGAAAERGNVALEPVAEVVDSTAAGDSFNAGFLASEGRGLDLPTRIAAAAAVAGQVVQGKGALVPLDRVRLPLS